MKITVDHFAKWCKCHDERGGGLEWIEKHKELPMGVLWNIMDPAWTIWVISRFNTKGAFGLCDIFYRLKGRSWAEMPHQWRLSGDRKVAAKLMLDYWPWETVEAEILEDIIDNAAKGF